MSSAVQIDHEWWSKQKETLDALGDGTNDLVVFRGGYGSGKTVLGARWIIRVGLRIPNGHSLVLAPDRQKGGPATYKGFFEQLPGDNTVPNEADGDPENSPVVAGYHGTKHRVTLPNGHIIQLGGADRWNRFAGSEFNAIWCDEVAHYENTSLYDLHEMLVTRQRTAAGPNVTLWTSTGNGYNQFYDITEREMQPNGEGGEEKIPWRDTMRVIVANTLKNPFLNEKDKMRRQFSGTEREQQALAGGFAAAKGLVYSQFSRETHIVDEADVPKLVDGSRSPIYGYDAGWDHPRVLIEWRRTHRDQWAAVDCYYAEETAFEDLCDPREGDGWLLENDKEKGPIYCEHEPEHIQKFRQAGYPAQKAEKSLDEGIPYVRGLLETKGDSPRPGLLVSDRCTELVQEFQSYKEEHVGKSGDVPDHCFVAGTMVLTETGERPIETIEPGDRVFTRDGFKRVIGAGKTNENVPVLTAYLSDGRTLTGTGSHPVHTESEGFVQLDSLRYGNTPTTVGSTMGVCQKLNQLSTTGSRSDATQTPTAGQTACTTSRQEHTSRTASKPSTERSGRTPMTPTKFPEGTSSTTSTATQPTTTPTTSNASRRENTPNATPKSTSARKTSKRESKPRKTGIVPRKAGSGIATTGKNPLPTCSAGCRKSVISAATSSPTTAPTRKDDTVQTLAKRKRGGSAATTMRNESARSADNRSRSTSIATQKPVRVVAVERSSRGRTVYNLTVEDKPEYFANGVLVHNCLDATRYCLFSHTPRTKTDPDDSGVSHL